MPTKAGRRTPRVPKLTWEMLRSHDDFHSPIGTWAVDDGISELIDTGLLKYPPELHATERKHLFWLIRPQLRGAALNALTWAAGLDEHVASRAERLDEMRELRALETQLQSFLDKLAGDAELMKQFTTSERIIHFPDQVARQSGLLFATDLQDYIDRRTPGLAPTKQPNADHLMQRFVVEMRFCWLFLTKQEAPKTGGKVLIKLAAGTWRDSKLPINFNDKEYTLDDWMAERFKALSGRG